MSSITDWTVTPIYAGFSKRIMFWSVCRVHNPYTDKAREEQFCDASGRIQKFRSECEAKTAIAKATA